jgi:broad specificity phosphatase PhoE
VTRFILVRHAHTDAVGRVLAGRAEGYGLNDTGRAEAARVARALGTSDISHVLSSPRQRAQETAIQIAQATGRVAETRDELDEIDFGDWNGHAFEALSGPGWAAWNSLRSLSPTPGGETMLQVQVRAVGLLQLLSARRLDAAIVLVSHSDVIKAVLSYALGAPIDLMQRFDIAPASMSEVALTTNDVRVNYVNRIA